MTKLCIFDLDGTLINSLYDLADGMNYALQKHGFEPHEPEKYRFMVGSGISTLADRAMVIPKGLASPEKKQEILADFNLYYNEHCMDKTRPYNGIKYLLDTLDSQHILYSVMSNKPDRFSNILIKALFPDHHFASVWGKRDNYERKPAPDAVWALIDELGIQRDECLYIGDSDVDVYTAKNAGLRFCGVSWGFRPKSELYAAGAAYIADTPADILTQL